MLTVVYQTTTCALIGVLAFSAASSLLQRWRVRRRNRRYVARIEALTWAHGWAQARKAVQGVVEAYEASMPLTRTVRKRIRAALAEEAVAIASDPNDRRVMTRLDGFDSCADQVLRLLDEAGAREVLGVEPLPQWAAVEASQTVEYDHA